MHSKLFAAAAVAACCLVAGCGGVTDPSQNGTDTFSGVINPGDTNFQFFGFNSSKTGEISAKFTALTPISNVTMGIVLAQAASDGSCTNNLGIVTPLQGAQLNLSTFLGQLPGRRYCLGVSLLQVLSQAESFTVTVSRP
jgi:hypothetical protein